MAATLQEPPRARGEVQVTLRPGNRLGRLRQSGSLKLLFPRSDRNMQAVLVNTAGGITGGDRFRVEATVEQDATLTLCTQAAERAYRAMPGSHGRLKTHLKVTGNGRVNWLPQETILFDGSALRRSLHVDLDKGSTCTLVEPLVFGRAAMGERLNSALFTDEIRIRRNGTTAFLDRTMLCGDIASRLDRSAVGAGAGAMALALHAAPDAARWLDPLRELLPETAGASLLGDDLLVMRALAPDSYALRRYLIPVLTLLTQQDLPRPWML